MSHQRQTHALVIMETSFRPMCLLHFPPDYGFYHTCWPWMHSSLVCGQWSESHDCSTTLLQDNLRERALNPEIFITQGKRNGSGRIESDGMVRPTTRSQCRNDRLPCSRITAESLRLIGGEELAVLYGTVTMYQAERFIASEIIRAGERSPPSEN